MTQTFTPGAMADSSLILEAVARSGDLGHYFDVKSVPAVPTWTISELPTDYIQERCQQTGAAINTKELRVAAATWHLGVVARVWSVTLGFFARHRLIIDPRQLFLVPKSGNNLCVHQKNPLPARFAHPELTGAQRDEVLITTLAIATFQAINSTVHTTTGLATGLLWGNVGSAAITTSTIVRSKLPKFNAADFITTAFSHPLLNATMTPQADGTWRRNSCCLFDQTPQGGLCGDCSKQPSKAPQTTGRR